MNRCQWCQMPLLGDREGCCDLCLDYAKEHNISIDYLIRSNIVPPHIWTAIEEKFGLTGKRPDGEGK